ncbi:unnamed protein product [Strongylus vulgaris]|uniref:Uncharacterized protein n=1 Tax=Strongylus vulgaris TaxID=40348 RepID=A0A3P7KQ57_STRVU|nr:unnamed protein product [Strongylus vulgaris]
MTKQPIRVIAQPPPRFPSQPHHYPASSTASVAPTLSVNTSQSGSNQPKSTYAIPTIGGLPVTR